MSLKSPLVARYPINTKGRDFVVGDIHGAFNLLLLAMGRVNFDANADRLFVVGDLIDRGEESARVAAFLKMPYVFAVRGNHEDMLIEMHANGEFPEITETHWMVVNNGLGWWVNTPMALKVEILEAIRKLPIVIEVETARGIVGIVHAEVESGLNWSEFIEAIEAEDLYVTKTALWGRIRIKDNDANGVGGIGRVFVGHNTQRGGLKRLGNVYYIDTGAIFAQSGYDNAQLTMINVVHKTSVLTTPNNILNLLDDPAATPFGQYAVARMVPSCR